MEDPIRTIAVGLLGAVALTAGILLIRSGRQESVEPTEETTKVIPPGESVAGTIVLERLRELGI